MLHCVGIENCYDERRDIDLKAAERICKEVGMDCRLSENDETDGVGFVVSKRIPNTVFLAQEYTKHTTRGDLDAAIGVVAERVAAAQAV